MFSLLSLLHLLDCFELVHGGAHQNPGEDALQNWNSAIFLKEKLSETEQG
jgi:hypothetical protein